MKTNKNIFSIILLATLLFSGCNELKQDKAPKSGVQIFNTNYVPANYKANPNPDSIVTFMWPSEEYFERYKAEGLFDYRDYQSFIAATSKEVFENGDAFDEWTLVFLNEGKKLQGQIAEIDLKIEPVKEKITELQSQINDLKKELKELEKEKKKSTREKSKLRKSKRALEAQADEDQARFVELNCKDVIEQQAGPNLVECKELKQSLLDIAEELAEVNAKYEEVMERIKELTDEIAYVKKEKIGPLFTAKKEIERDQLAPLNEERKPLVERVDAIITHQAEMIARVQTALDPQAVTYDRDEDGNLTYDHYGFVKRKVNESKQVNWIKMYKDTAGQSNSFDIKGDVIHINFSEWGENKVSYKTSYKKDENGRIVYDENGQPVLESDSDFSLVKLGARDFIEFKMPEKDKRGNLTGKIYEFKLQRSPFDVHLRMIGDMTLTYQGKVERRGQIKILLTKNNK